MSGVVRSMTGFASVEGSFPDGARFAVTAKSVNHRFLDLQLRLPGGCEALEADLRRLAKEHVLRGHLELAVEIGRAAVRSVQVNWQHLDAVLEAWRALAEKIGGGVRPEPAVLLQMPGVLTTDTKAPQVGVEQLRSALVPAATACLALLNTAREREGADLAIVLGRSMEQLGELCTEVRQLRREVQPAHLVRLRERMQDLLAGTEVSEDRLLAEAALLAEKSDVEEEMVRLRAHVDRFLALLAQGGAVGKPLDFLLQELNREANTTLSKTGSAAGQGSLRMTELGLAMKTEIERAREQVQNLE